MPGFREVVGVDVVVVAIFIRRGGVSLVTQGLVQPTVILPHVNHLGLKQDFLQTNSKFALGCILVSLNVYVRFCM